MSDTVTVWRDGEAVELAREEAQIPDPPTPEELDAQAEAQAAQLFQGDPATTALSNVLVDLTMDANDLTQEEAQERVKEPVSYTHLTLPTKA